MVPKYCKCYYSYKYVTWQETFSLKHIPCTWYTHVYNIFKGASLKLFPKNQPTHEQFSKPSNLVLKSDNYIATYSLFSAKFNSSHQPQIINDSKTKMLFRVIIRGSTGSGKTFPYWPISIWQQTLMEMTEVNVKQIMFRSPRKWEAVTWLVNRWPTF